MIRLPPSSTRTDTLFPYTTLFRSYSKDNLEYVTLTFSGFLTSFIYNDKFNLTTSDEQPDSIDASILFLKQHISQALTLKEIADHVHLSVSHFSGLFHKRTGFSPIEYLNRSEESRVGKECVSTCRSRWSPYH